MTAHDPNSSAEVINARLEEDDEAKGLLAGLLEPGTEFQAAGAELSLIGCGYVTLGL